MAKKTVSYKAGDKIYILGAQFQIVKIRNGNVTVRPVGGYDMEGEVLTLRQPVYEKADTKWSDPEE